MATERVYVPQENVYYDSTADDPKVVRTFRGLLQRGLDGEFVALGAYSLDRISRNLQEAIAIKRQMRAHGIDLMLARGQRDDR